MSQENQLRDEKVNHWLKVSKEKLRDDLRSTSRHKDELEKSINQIIEQSPDFKLKKINNYDNTVKNMPRHFFEKSKKMRPNIFESKKLSRNVQFESLSKDCMIDPSATVYNNNKSRSILSTTMTKDFNVGNSKIIIKGPTNVSFQSPYQNDKSYEKNLKMKEHLNKLRGKKDQSYFDSNISNELVYRKKIID